MAEIDFDKPVEAVDDDGWIMRITDVEQWGNEEWPYRGMSEFKTIYLRKDGKCCRRGWGDMEGWVVRNVDPTLENLTERCVALVRKLSEAPGSAAAGFLRDEAKAIIAAMNPTDPDLIEARDCVAKVYEDAGRNDLAIATRDGKQDNRLRVQSALAAFRRGRDFGK